MTIKSIKEKNRELKKEFLLKLWQENYPDLNKNLKNKLNKLLSTAEDNIVNGVIKELGKMKHIDKECQDEKTEEGLGCWYNQALEDLKKRLGGELEK